MTGSEIAAAYGGTIGENLGFYGVMIGREVRSDYRRHRGELGPGAFPVRGMLFDKTPVANWKVGWHQDLTIAVQHRVEAPGYGPWSEKAGVVHVQPPVAVLETMLAVRLHIDECGTDNGPLRVLAGSHRAGKLRDAEIPSWRSRVPEQVCVVPRGGVLLMRPLLLHASSPASSPQHRRVLHLEYAGCDLAAGLEWRWRRQISA